MYVKFALYILLDYVWDSLNGLKSGLLRMGRVVAPQNEILEDDSDKWNYMIMGYVVAPSGTTAE